MPLVELLRTVRHLTPLLALPLVVACQEQVQAPPKPECTPNSFRACETDACRGVEQCVDPGFWSSCACTITDASFPDAETAADAAADAATDAGPDADASDGS